MDARCRIELLGELRVEQNGRVMTRFRTRKFGLLLAYLAFYLHRSHPRDELIEMLWPECDPDAGRNRLNTALTSLRHQLAPPEGTGGSLIAADRFTVRLNPGSVSTDVGVFESLLQAAARARGTEQARLLAEAVQVYRGPLLPGYYEEWIAPERARLVAVYLRAVRALAGHLEQAGDLSGAIAVTERALSADPLLEETYCDLMRLYTAAGQPFAALRQYHLLERTLKQQIGTAPSPAANRLAHAIAAEIHKPSGPPPASPTLNPPPFTSDTGRPPDGGDSLPSPRASSRPTANLPARFTRFFGRESEIQRLVDLLAPAERGEGRGGSSDRLSPPPSPLSARLLTLTGPGGSGKTRLALEVAEHCIQPYAGAVFFVPLADVADPSRIPDAILTALRLPRHPEREPLEQVLERLSRQPSLLILDNFEHVVEGADVVRALLEGAPPLTCLVTSRQVLGLSLERALPVAPLATPGEEIRKLGTWGIEQPVPQFPDFLVSQFPSVRLFLDRAQAVRPDFQITAHNAAAVAELCTRLEGIPLAIELAAARAQVLTPAQMLAQLAHRLEFLVSRKRDVVERHQSLRAAIEWSYRLLSPELQRFFRSLSVFRGGWRLEAADTVCGCEEPYTPTHPHSHTPTQPSTLDTLEHLRSASLILAEETGEEMRYRMLETLREYAGEQLEERRELARRHAGYYVQLAERGEPELRGPNQAAWLDRFEIEHDNFRAALDWAGAAGDTETGLRLGAALWRFWLIRGYWAEGRKRLAGLLAVSGAAGCTAARAGALQGAGALARDQGDFVEARAHAEESVAIWRALGDRQGLGWALNSLGLAAHAQDCIEEARALYQEGLALCRDQGDRWGEGWALNDLGNGEYYQGNYQAARARYEESLAIRREIGDLRGMAWTLDGLANVACCLEEYEAAQACQEESLAIRRGLGDRSGVAWSLITLGLVAEKQGDYGPARARYEESLATWCELGVHTRAKLAYLLNKLTRIAEEQGDAAAARTYRREAEARGIKLGDAADPPESRFWSAFVGGRQDSPSR